MNEDRSIDPCPACGGDGKLDWNANMEEPRFRVKCKGCGKTTKFYREMDQAETAWGQRQVQPLHVVS